MKKLKKLINNCKIRNRAQVDKESASGKSSLTYNGDPVQTALIIPQLCIMDAKTYQQGRYQRPPNEAKRKRALSISESNNEFGNLTDQNTSLFFRIPLELREMVYAELFGASETIWIVLADQKLACVREEQTNVTQQDDRPTKLGLHAIPLLQSCRRIYSEAISLLYSTPTFAFNETLAFLAFSASILPSRFQSLRFIVINLSRQGVPGHVSKISLGLTLSNPHRRSMDYTLLHKLKHLKLYNASILPEPNKTLLPDYLWDAVANALEEMKGVQDVFLSLKDVTRIIEVWVERGYEHSGERDARDIRNSLAWVGRDRPWKGEGKEDGSGERREKQRETRIVFENVWRKSSEWTRGHWVREMRDDGEIEWKEVGEAAAPWDGEFLYW